MPRALYQALVKALPRAGQALGKEKQPSRRRRLGRSLCRGPSPRALDKDFFLKNLCRGPPTMALGKEMCRIFPKNLCRGQWDGPRQRIILFFENSLPRASTQALGKEILFFKKKSLPRVSNHGPRHRNVAEILFFKKKSLPSPMGRPSAKDPSLPRALVIALGKEAEI